MTEGGTMPYTARYYRYMQKGEEECDTLDEAVAYLASGWERGDLAEVDIVGPDGTVVLDGAALHDRMMSLLT